MSIQLHHLGDKNIFPHPNLALPKPNGLLAFGGDLSVKRLVSAYQSGIFPWFSEGEPLLWWSPDPRGVLMLNEYHCSSSLRKFIRKTTLSVTLNKSFMEVVTACAESPRKDSGTWITQEMVNAYSNLHEAGYAHSIEIWEENSLVGGLYGVAVGAVYCGESMFHRISNASKLAFYCLVQHLTKYQFSFIDCQMQTHHLHSMGVKEVPRKVFLKLLLDAQKQQSTNAIWKPKTLLHKGKTIL